MGDGRSRSRDSSPKATRGKNQNDPSQTGTFVTAVLKNNGTTEFALRGGDATTGSLSTYYKGVLPAGWSPMKKQGAIVLGSGGDCCATNTNLSDGTFYEGCLVSGYPSDATENAHSSEHRRCRLRQIAPCASLAGRRGPDRGPRRNCVTRLQLAGQTH